MVESFFFQKTSIEDNVVNQANFHMQNNICNLELPIVIVDKDQRKVGRDIFSSIFKPPLYTLFITIY